jgi:hypothetical protein
MSLIAWAEKNGQKELSIFFENIKLYQVIFTIGFFLI